MPTYLYECDECGRFEKMQSIKASPLKECPKCGSEVRRIIGSPGVIFKGSGFYCTDTRNKKPSSGTAESKKPAESSGKSDGSSSKEASEKAS